jgi:predicted Zn-dependent protease
VQRQNDITSKQTAREDKALRFQPALILISLSLAFALSSPQAESANKKAPAHKAGAGSASAGSPYPQCQYGGSKVVRWIPQEMPLHVYIAPGTSLDQAGADPNGGPLNNTDNTAQWPELVYGLIKSPEGLSKLDSAKTYDENMWQAAAEGINEWKRFQNEGLYSFEITKDPQEANVFIFWTDQFVNKLGLALFENDIRGYTAKHLLPYAQVIGALNQGNTGLIERSLRPVVVQLRTTDSNKNPMPLAKLKASAAHEMGHVLGIDGHSQNPNDLMSVYYGNGQISPNDAATIRYIYHHNPDLLP